MIIGHRLRWRRGGCGRGKLIRAIRYSNPKAIPDAVFLRTSFGVCVCVCDARALVW